MKYLLSLSLLGATVICSMVGERERERGARDVGWPASKRGKKADRIVSNKQVVIIFLK